MNDIETQTGIPGWDAVADAGRVAPPSAATVAAAQAAVDAVIAASMRGQRAVADGSATGGTGVTGVTALDVVRARRRRRWLALTSVAAAVVTACAVASALVGPGTAPSAAPTAQGSRTAPAGHGTTAPAGTGAQGFLDAVADVAYTQQVPTAPAPYWKMRMVAYHADGAGRPVTYTEWLSRTGATVAVDGAKYTKSEPQGLTWDVGGQPVDWNGLDRLPTDPRALAKRVTRLGPGQAFTDIGGLLGASPARPALRAALYRVLAGLDGVRVVGAVTDSTGRRGTAVELTTPTTTERLTVDPATGVLLEQSTVARKPTPADPHCTVLPGNPGRCQPAFRAGELITRVTYLQLGPATSTTNN